MVNLLLEVGAPCGRRQPLIRGGEFANCGATCGRCDEWAHIEPLIPPGKPGGGKRRVAIREVINGVMYILSTGCQWRALPKDLPPRSTVHDYLGLWNWDGTLDRIHHALYLKCREKAAREASPTACIIDSQSVKSAEKGGLASTATASMPAS